MTDTTSNLSVSPADILLHIIVSLLAPLFLVASDGDIQFARMAAIETINAYRARNPADLIVIAQVIACSLSALGSLSLAMADNLSVAMTLRLRGNAVALNRIAEQNRRALCEARPETAPVPEFDPESDLDFDEVTVIANVAATQERAAQAVARMQGEAKASRPPPTQTQAPAVPPPSAVPPASPISPPSAIPPPSAVPPPSAIPPASPISPPSAASEPTPADRERHAIWGAAAARVAQEYTASLPFLSPVERKNATIRAAALSSCANQLLAGNGPPPFNPGDPSTLIPKA